MEATTAASRAAVDAVPLRANREFRLLWVGQALSDFGTSMTALVLPLALLSSGYSTSATSTIGTAVLVTAMVLRMPAGYLTDHYSHRRLMLVADLARLVTVATVAVWTYLDRLPIALAVVTVVVAQVGVELFRPSQNATVRRVVPAAQLGTAISLNQARAYAAGIIAPAVAGVLIAASLWLPFAIDAVTYAVSALCVLALYRPLRRAEAARSARPDGGAGRTAGRDGTREAEAGGEAKEAEAGGGAKKAEAGGGAKEAPPERFLHRLTAGLRHVVRDPFLRTLAGLAAGDNFAFQALAYALLLGIGREHNGAAAVGLAMSAAAVTGLTGSLIAPFLQHRLRMQTVMAAGPALAGVMLALAWYTGSGIAFAAGYSALCLLTPVNGAVFGTILATTVPENIYGRTTTALGFITEILQPLGPLTAGLLLAYLSLSGTAAVFAVAFTVLAVVALLMPSPPAVPDTEKATA
ncbi:MFS transporter [Streptomyces sp. NBC_00103]|uniref:MFS transporter n=1 Tax=Streptomyces sp. NBC_00103 TaxID=2975653 RepID=UPI002254BA11|nr:MFS transporter [Streptomyces sp. NBC_00103]MCX5372822.1 MFS transporter [Streptomyces sp. NBC_00103]